MKFGCENEAKMEPKSFPKWSQNWLKFHAKFYWIFDWFLVAFWRLRQRPGPLIWVTGARLPWGPAFLTKTQRKPYEMIAKMIKKASQNQAKNQWKNQWKCRPGNLPFRPKLRLLASSHCHEWLRLEKLCILMGMAASGLARGPVSCPFCLPTCLATFWRLDFSPQTLGHFGRPTMNHASWCIMDDHASCMIMNHASVMTWIMVNHQWFCIIMHHGSWSIMDHHAPCMITHHRQPWGLPRWPWGWSGSKDTRKTPKWLRKA